MAFDRFTRATLKHTQLTMRSFNDPTATATIHTIMDAVRSMFSRSRAYSKPKNIFPVRFPAAFFKFPTVKIVIFHDSNFVENE
jgi:hypothetical protein